MTQYTYQERFRTAKGVFDEFTNRNLFELESKGEFDKLVSPLEVGKESNVFLAEKDGKKIIVKIYRVQNCDFKRMFEYIGKDVRYQFLKHKPRDIVFAWTQREYRNLLHAAKHKVRVPKVLGLKYNILIEEMIGGKEPAPPLKDAHPADPEKFFKAVVKEMKKMYNGGLIHGDLSSFNILNHKDKPVLIDFSQATLIRTPNSEELLERDIKNICNFFRKLGVKADVGEVLKKITAKTR
jgi:RIO kinase 1